MTNDNTPQDLTLIESLDRLARAERAEPDAGFERRIARATEPTTRVLPFSPGRVFRVMMASAAMAAVVAITALLPLGSPPARTSPAVAQGPESISEHELLSAFGFGIEDDTELALIEAELIELEIDSAERAWLFEGSL